MRPLRSSQLKSVFLHQMPNLPAKGAGHFKMGPGEHSILCGPVPVGNYRVKTTSLWNSPFSILLSNMHVVQSISAKIAHILQRYGILKSSLLRTDYESVLLTKAKVCLQWDGIVKSSRSDFRRRGEKSGDHLNPKTQELRETPRVSQLTACRTTVLLSHNKNLKSRGNFSGRK
jgi:hypothetical protein